MNSFIEKVAALLLPDPGSSQELPAPRLSTRVEDIVSRAQFLVLPAPEDLTYGFLLKHHREARGLSQEKLAKLSGIGQKHVSNIELGLTQPRWSTLRKFFIHLDPKFEQGARFVFHREMEKRGDKKLEFISKLDWR